MFYALMALLAGNLPDRARSLRAVADFGRLDRYGYRPHWRSFSERDGNSEKRCHGRNPHHYQPVRAVLYRFSLLSPGSYTVGVSAQGFSKTESRFTVNVGQTTVANVKVTVGSSTQTVEVTGAPPLVQTDNANLSTNFNSNIIQNQPNGGNDLTYIAQTAPGVTMNTGQGYGNFSAYGLPATSNLFTVNGENDMDPYLNLNNSGATNLTLGKNEVQEATVISNAYSGQYGQQAGAQINYVTKSGTNQYHGNVQYSWTGRAMDANDWFNNHTTPITARALCQQQ